MSLFAHKFSIAVFLTLALCSSAISIQAADEETESFNEFLDMDISQLMQVTITSVSKKPEPLADAAAAVFVIRSEDIQRSGVTTIQDALRLAPGVHVARIGSDKWVVGTRGFNGRYTNKLLVLIDGRTIYSPVFAGVYWEMQGTLLEDIERIEVIRGPGATLWGANAVNGVINIITKKTVDTHGGLLRVAAGTEEEGQVALRYGWPLTRNIDARLYSTYEQRDSFKLLRDGSDAQDDWDTFRSGFRIDGDAEKKTIWTAQGDVYKNRINQLFSPYWLPVAPYLTELREEFDASGWNILGKIQRTFTDESKLSFQMYYDFTRREETALMQEHSTIDLDLQYQKKIGRHNDITAGIGYRLIDAEFSNSFQVSLSPEDIENTTYSGFIQDAIALAQDSLTLTLGTKWEHNDYTGTELQPSGRILWKAKRDTTVWGAISRAVRAPSQIERGGSLVTEVIPDLPPYPAVITLSGHSGFDSEEVLTYEAGYRWFPSESFSFDFTAFYNDYDKLQVFGDNPENPYDILFVNGAGGNSQGFELAVSWKPVDWTKLDLTYSYINFDISSDITPPSDQIQVYEESVPTHMLSLFSQFTVSPKLDFNLWLRYVDELPASSIYALTFGLEVDSYWEADITINYQVTDSLKLSLIGQNLLNSNKLEFVSESFTAPTEVERGVYLKALFTF